VAVCAAAGGGAGGGGGGGGACGGVGDGGETSDWLLSCCCWAPPHPPTPQTPAPTAGPVFDELADPLRDAFAAYLEERGVNEDLGEFVRHALYDKEQREYIGWLEKVGGFVE